MSVGITRLVFWQNILSIHQSAFVRALADRPELEVWFAYEEDLSDTRRAMGWKVPDFGAAKLADVRDTTMWKHLVAMDDAANCHIFGSYFRMPQAYGAFRRLLASPCRRVWTTEAFDFHGWQGWFRLQRVRWHIWREGRVGFHRILAMGGLGQEFFRLAGIKSEQLCEFGYLVEPPPIQPSDHEPQRDKSACRFLFVGQMIRRKGVDLLLRAAGQLPQMGWSLDLIGDGVERVALMALADKQRLSPRVRFLGNLTNDLTLAAISSADALVLPSRWDGWGAVVNEALMVGTPAIVSDGCGAASLIVNDTCGVVCRRADLEALRGALQAVLEQRANTEPRRQRLRSWAQRALSGRQLASYFLSCVTCSAIEHSHPPPWRTEPQL